VRSKSAAVDEDSVKADAIANAPAYQHPRRVIFIDESLLACTNKVDKRALASWIPKPAEKASKLRRLTQPRFRPGQSGFTKSSTTACASASSATAIECG